MRRIITFNQLAEAEAECKQLLASGYSKSGNWSLGQICRHLRLTIEANMEGYPAWMLVLGFPLRPILRRFALPSLLAGKSPKGIKTAPMFVPPDGIDDSTEVDALSDCIAQFLAFKGKLHAHPGFGAMTHEKFEAFHAAHAAHHLGFLQSA